MEKKKKREVKMIDEELNTIACDHCGHHRFTRKMIDKVGILKRKEGSRMKDDEIHLIDCKYVCEMCQTTYKKSISS